MIAIPIYLAQLDMIEFVEPSMYPLLNDLSKYLLYASGIGGVLAILYHVIRAYIRRRRVYATLISGSG
jgi:hypothetical protein